MTKKHINIFLIILIFLLTIFIVIFSINYLNTDKSVTKSSKEQKHSSNSLSLMYETTPETGEYQVSNDSIWLIKDYSFNSKLSKCENGSILTYDSTTNKVKVQSTKSDKCYVYFDKIQTIGNKCKNQNMASCMKTNYQLDNNINFHNSSLANGANDNSYRYSGANPNNYVCFGPGATAAGTVCPEENQYRIIGVFGNQAKLIKKTSVETRQWNSPNINTWLGSKMEKYLNNEYLNGLTTIWGNKIATNTWQVGGMSGINGTSLPTTVYTYEVGPNKANITFNGKIGLMYVSDYGFSASPNNWTLVLYHKSEPDYRICTANNWLFAGSIHSTEVVISPDIDTNFYVFNVSSLGYSDAGSATTWFAFRPSFYLESSINLIGGNGTDTNPYRV